MAYLSFIPKFIQLYGNK